MWRVGRKNYGRVTDSEGDGMVGADGNCRVRDVYLALEVCLVSFVTETENSDEAQPSLRLMHPASRGSYESGAHVCFM